MTDLMYNEEHKKIIKDLLGEKWFVDYYQHATDPGMTFQLGIQIKYDWQFLQQPPLQQLDQKILEIEELIKGTHFYKRLEESKKVVIENKDSHIEQLEAEIDRLREYEIYFNKEKEMRNNEPS